MLASVNRKASQRVALAAQVGQSRYVPVFIDLQNSRPTQIVTISEQGIDRSHSERGDWFTIFGIKGGSAKERLPIINEARCSHPKSP